MSSTAEVEIFSDADEVATQLCSYIEQVAEVTLAEKGRFVIGLSGGSVATLLNRHLPDIVTDWSQWHIFLCDERVVAKDDPECTWTLYKEGLLSRVSEMGEERLYGVEDPEAPLEDIARDYRTALENVVVAGEAESPAPDMVILGLGPDGHTASLFPDRSSLDSSDVIIVEEDSPKPPPNRISMSVKTLNAVSSAVFVVCGESKADIMAQIFDDENVGGANKSLPASLVNPTKGCLSWYLDVGAAKKLKPPVISPHQKRTVDAAFTFKEMMMNGGGSGGKEDGEGEEESVENEEDESKEEENEEDETSTADD